MSPYGLARDAKPDRCGEPSAWANCNPQASNSVLAAMRFLTQSHNFSILNGVMLCRMPFMRHRLFSPNERLFLNMTQIQPAVLEVFHDVSRCVVKCTKAGAPEAVSGRDSVREMPDRRS